MHTEKQHAESGCTDYLQHNWDSCPENKAQHSKHSRIIRASLRERQQAAEKLIVASVNHAEALAEALRHLMAITRNDEALQYREASEALAAYEADKR